MTENDPNIEELTEEEEQLVDLLRRYNVRTDAIKKIKQYLISKSNIINKRNAANIIRKGYRSYKFPVRVRESYERTQSIKRAKGLKQELRPIIAELNSRLPAPIIATEGYNKATEPNNIRIDLKNTRSILPNIKGTHITFIRQGGNITSTHFTFAFPDQWRREPLIPKDAQDLRIGIDLNNTVNINYRLNDMKQPPIQVFRNNNNALVNYFYTNFVENLYYAEQIYTYEVLTTIFNQIHNILQIVRIYILNNPNLVNIIITLRGGSKSKKLKRKHKKSKKT